MPRALRSWLRKGFRRHENASHQPDGQDVGRDGDDKTTSAVVVSSCASLDEGRDSTALSSTSIHATLASTALSSDSIHAASPPSTASAAQPPSPPTPRTDSPNMEMPAGADGAPRPPGLPVQLWDHAYDRLKQEEPELVDTYEKILSRQLQDGLGSTVPPTQPNTVDQNPPDARRHQMTQLIHAGLDNTAREAKIKERLGTTIQIVRSVKNAISSAIQAMPQAALAWTGICVLLDVRCFIQKVPSVCSTQVLIVTGACEPVAETEANRKGIEYVVRKMDWYWSLSGPLLKPLPDHVDGLSGARRQLETQIVDLYRLSSATRSRASVLTTATEVWCSSEMRSSSTIGTQTWALSGLPKRASGTIPRRTQLSK